MAAESITEAQVEGVDGLEKLHEFNHFGMKRTMFLAKKVWGENRVSEDQVKSVVKGCNQCASIDPAPIKWDKGELSSKRTWKRLVVDVTHVEGKKFLTVVDCGPSRFMIWRQIE